MSIEVDLILENSKFLLEAREMKPASMLDRQGLSETEEKKI